MNTAVQNPQLGTIYTALNSLSVSELEAVMQQVIGIRKQKMPNILTEVETDLLNKINMPITATIQRRYNKLIKLKTSEQLNNIEYNELLELSNYIETHDNQRLRHIIELSQFRNQNLEETLNSLGYNAKPNVV